MKIEHIISGGQTGADRAALDWALLTDCPKNRGKTTYSLGIDGSKRETVENIKSLFKRIS